MMRHERQSAGTRRDGDDEAWKSGGGGVCCSSAFEFAIGVGYTERVLFVCVLLTHCLT